MTETSTKTCTKCGVAKGLECFSNYSRGKFGVLARCKQCARAEKSLAQKNWVANLSFRYVAQLEGRRLWIEWQDVSADQVDARRAQIMQKRTEAITPPDERPCSGCGVTLPISAFPFHSGRRLKKCAACVAARNKKYREQHAADIARWRVGYKAANVDRIAAVRRKYWISHRTRYYENNSKWIARNPDRFKEIRRRVHQKEVAELSESYVRGQLAKQTSANRADIPSSLVQLTTINLKIKRLLRQRKQA